ncbi:hypothetical protein KIN20_034604 [Parelaphostrongylus tenuis]|uniref:Uncharacterized protein n=1 Tax=Parelaphostrongylus tenuis TaxID=148309 RepID=A0AAD5RAM7_PARTN|nr:hypothetical protein KIN20_034604 [Parelaphostrongylus tenuis]
MDERKVIEPKYFVTADNVTDCCKIDHSENTQCREVDSKTTISHKRTSPSEVPRSSVAALNKTARKRQQRRRSTSTTKLCGQSVIRLIGCEEDEDC